MRRAGPSAAKPCPRVEGVSTERWKHCTAAGDVDEPYELREDPDEPVELAGRAEHAGVAREHRRLLLDWVVDSEDTRAKARGHR